MQGSVQIGRKTYSVNLSSQDLKDPESLNIVLLLWLAKRLVSSCPIRPRRSSWRYTFPCTTKHGLRLWRRLIGFLIGLKLSNVWVYLSKQNWELMQTFLIGRRGFGNDFLLSHLAIWFGFLLLVCW